ncbi:MAG: 2-vinyl bacteriochlorophyllide hydratase [Paracoccaceae bacterium]|jgi:3-vinyl bacteriochlorophyllide hydratase|tara:strand:- start:15187 stop:15699 length:513 start_codon:yes stop_codon:yes gene_type:complete
MHKQSSPQVDGWNLYTPSQRIIRDRTVWTKVQAILAPLQFIVCVISLALVLRYLFTDEGYYIATVSIVVKSFLLLLIMVTGAIWEKVVFGQFLFAEAFFWEDVVSFFVIFFHGLYLYVLLSGDFLPTSQMLVALFAYFLYFINAFQFLRKLRLARKSGQKRASLKGEVNK